MPDIPECLGRRHKLLDSLIQDMNMTTSTGPGDRTSECCPSSEDGTRTTAPESDVGNKLMCDFWKTLEDDPECGLRQEIQLRMCSDSCQATCQTKEKEKCFQTKCPAKMEPPPSPPSPARCESECGGKEDESTPKSLGTKCEASSFEQNCSSRVGEFEEVQKDLFKAINDLEQKAQKGTGLLKEADCMWSCMEGEYKRQLSDAKEHVELLEYQLSEVETSLKKWQKIHKELEDELKCVKKCNQDTKIKVIQKENDIKVMKVEIEGYNRRIESNKKDMVTAQNSYSSKKEASDDRLSRITKEIEIHQKQYTEECQCYAGKEKEGHTSVKGVREDLQKLCRCLLQKKMENEDLEAEAEALVNEVDILQKTCQSCKERCVKRENDIQEESQRIDKEIANFKVRCQSCHKETTSADLTGFCIECPRCLRNDRECLNVGDHCSVDHSHDCVCTRVKHTFLNNVFENMYTVLERQVQTCTGKELADCILDSLKRSKNGKLNAEARSILQDFILNTVRQNLNLTIVGGAMKTRCEMDQETYDQLMLCLKDVSVTIPEKEEKGTVPRKLPCPRWSRTGECHCPKGPKSCPCSKMAAKKSTSPSTCGPVEEEEVLEDRSVKNCPIREPVASALDCGMLGLPGSQSWKRAPCEGALCSFSPNMRAAQCVLGPEVLADVRKKIAEGCVYTVAKADEHLHREEGARKHGSIKHATIDESPTTEDGEKLTTKPLKEEERTLTQDKCPLTQDKCPLTQDKCPLTQDKCPLAQDERPLTENKQPTEGTYFVSCNNDESFNATLRKTPPKGILLIPQSFEELCQKEHEDKHSFEVNFCVMRNQLLELPAVLRPTKSNNYIVVLDKEFEKCYYQSVKEYFGDKFEGSVNLQMTDSGNYILELHNTDKSHNDDKKRNAWLGKTSSGNIKVIVRPEFQFIFQQELSLSSASSVQLNNNIPTTSKDFHRDSKKRSKNLYKQSSIGKLKVKLLDSLPLPSLQSSAILKKNFASHPDLNEEAKKSLVIDSDSLKCNSENLIFLKRLDSAEVIIKLNSKDDAKTHYGTLKLTPSGNFYVAVDDDVIKDLTESSAKNDSSTMSSSVGMRSKHAMELIDSVHKSFAITCQSANVCDPSACGCTGTTFDSKDGSIEYFCSCQEERASTTIDNLKINDSFPIPSTSRDEKALLDVDPSFESSNSQRGSHKNVFKSSDQCYYLHQLCNDEFCFEHLIRPKETIVLVENQPCQAWDSLNYLPQQLPHFLREV